MTPDTTSYTIAGFVVILGGILIYVVSIFVRENLARRQMEDLESVTKNLPTETWLNREDQHDR